MQDRVLNLPLNISAKALFEIHHIFRNKNIPANYALRIGSKGSGCSGVDFFLGFDLPKPEDMKYVLEGLPIIIDKKQVLYIAGITLDHIDSAEQKGFTFLK